MNNEIPKFILFDGEIIQTNSIIRITPFYSTNEIVGCFDDDCYTEKFNTDSEFEERFNELCNILQVHVSTIKSS